MYILHKELNFILPETRLILPQRRSTHFGFGGNEVRGILYDNEKDMNIIQDTGWIKNTWTDLGKQRLGAHITHMAIGSDNAATQPADVSLGALLAGPDQSTLSNSANNGGPGYDFYSIMYERFVAGDGTGTIEEIGMFHSTSTTGLCCRAVITPIVKGAANVLDMWYRCNCTPYILDKTGSVLIDGVNYDWTLRPYDVDLWTRAWNGAGWGNSASATADPLHTNIWDSRGTGDIMNIHTGTIDFSGKKSDWSTTAYLDECNFTLPDGIKTAYCRTDFGAQVGTEGGLGVGFVATDGPNIGGGVPKDDTMYFTVQWNLTWDGV